MHGQPNIYALFMAVSAALLRPGGWGVFITPRSYTSGQYFSRFRAYFFDKMRPRAFHLFASRRDIFASVLQENLILLAERSNQDSDIVLSSSINGGDFSQNTRQVKTSSQVIGQDNVLHLSLHEKDGFIANLLQSWYGKLQEYGLKISTGPVVPFRASSFISSAGEIPLTHAPLLWMQNVKPMCCAWPVKHKGQYLTLHGADKLLVPNNNYVLVRRFSAKEEKQRLTAAPYLAHLDTPVIGIENHLNYIYRPKGQLSVDEARGLAVLLNSTIINDYFRSYNGNTQVSTTELRNLPLPPLDTIIEIGQRASQTEKTPDDLVFEVFALYA